MKKSIIIYSVLVLVFGTSSCGRNKENSTEKSEKTKCYYTYDKTLSTLEWTAFKYTEKSPVKGTFNNFNIYGGIKSENAKQLLESLNFSINTNTVETQNPDRNSKIASLFFKTIHTEKINGKVKSLGKNGVATIQLTMNKITQDIKGKYLLEDGNFSFKATIDVLSWNASEGIKRLNEACKDLHTGADGKSKLWNEVEIAFTTKLVLECE